MERNYSYSKCPKCQSTNFEMEDDRPTGSKFTIMFIRCSSCKTVVGTADYYNIGSLIHDLAKKLKVKLDD